MEENPNHAIDGFFSRALNEGEAIPPRYTWGQIERVLDYRIKERSALLWQWYLSPAGIVLVFFLGLLLQGKEIQPMVEVEQLPTEKNTWAMNAGFNVKKPVSDLILVSSVPANDGFKCNKVASASSFSNAAIPSSIALSNPPDGYSVLIETQSEENKWTQMEFEGIEISSDTSLLIIVGGLPDPKWTPIEKKWSTAFEIGIVTGMSVSYGDISNAEAGLEPLFGGSQDQPRWGPLSLSSQLHVGYSVKHSSGFEIGIFSGIKQRSMSLLTPRASLLSQPLNTLNPNVNHVDVYGGLGLLDGLPYYPNLFSPDDFEAVFLADEILGSEVEQVVQQLDFIQLPLGIEVGYSKGKVRGLLGLSYMADINSSRSTQLISAFSSQTISSNTMGLRYSAGIHTSLLFEWFAWLGLGIHLEHQWAMGSQESNYAYRTSPRTMSAMGMIRFSLPSVKRRAI